MLQISEMLALVSKCLWILMDLAPVLLPAPPGKKSCGVAHWASLPPVGQLPPVLQHPSGVLSRACLGLKGLSCLMQNVCICVFFCN